jgi:hypothetical protein
LCLDKIFSIFNFQFILNRYRIQFLFYINKISHIMLPLSNCLKKDIFSSKINLFFYFFLKFYFSYNYFYRSPFFNTKKIPKIIMHIVTRLTYFFIFILSNYLNVNIHKRFFLKNLCEKNCCKIVNPCEIVLLDFNTLKNSLPF